MNGVATSCLPLSRCERPGTSEELMLSCFCGRMPRIEAPDLNDDAHRTDVDKTGRENKLILITSKWVQWSTEMAT